MTIMKCESIQGELFSCEEDPFEERRREQQEVICAPVDRHLQIIAGPGAGKTRVLVSRIAFLIKSGYDPNRMAVITYTNSARDELLQRIDKELGLRARGLFVGTIHQLCLGLVLDASESLGIKGRVRVVDEADARRMFTALIARSGWTDTRISFDELSLERERWNGKAQPPWSDADNNEVWKMFDTMMRRLGLVSFTSLQMWALESLKTVCKPVLQHILVDEYQDTTGLQVRLLEAMSSLGTTVTVVGDPEQSIFRFAGADPLQLVDFPNRFSPCSCHTLMANARSSQSIVRLVGVFRDGPAQFSLRMRGVPPSLWYFDSELQQAKRVCVEIKRLVDQGNVTPGQVAILAREGQQSPIAEELEHMGIDYWQSKSEKFEQRPHVRQLILLLDAMSNPEDESAQLFLFEQVIKGAPKTWELLASEHAKGIGFDEAIGTVEKKVTRPRMAALGEFRTIRTNLAKLKQLSPSELVKELLNQVMEPRFTVTERRIADDIRDDIQRVADLALRHDSAESLSAWLRQGGVSSQVDGDSVTLGTFHFAKGREWNVVFVVDLTLGVVPHRLNPDDEEERRLLHVAVSRARDRLYLSSPRRLLGRAEGHSPLLDRLRKMCKVVDFRQ